MIERKENWQESLTEYLASVSQTKFKYGEFDCALFSAGAVKAMTGEDLSSQFGKYKTRAAGIKALSKKGFKNYVDFIEKHFDEIPPAFLQPGDIAILGEEEAEALGIVQGAAIYVISPDGCLSLKSLLEANRGFRVKHQGE